MKHYRRSRTKCTICGKWFRSQTKAYKHIDKEHDDLPKGVKPDGIDRFDDEFFGSVWTFILVLIVVIFLLSRCGISFGYDDEDYAREQMQNYEYNRMQINTDDATRIQLDNYRLREETWEGTPDRKLSESEDFYDQEKGLTNSTERDTIKPNN